MRISRADAGNAWPDLAVADIMAVLALISGWVVARQARSELTQDGHRHAIHSYY